MAPIVLALLLVVRAGETGRSAWLLGAAAALGIAFNVKLLESLVAVPGLVVLAWMALPGPRRRRAAADAGGGAPLRGGGAVVADGDAAGARARSAIGDRLDERQRVERGVRVQRHRPPERQNDRTAHAVPPGLPLSRGDAVRARPHPDRAALADPPAGARGPAVGRAARARDPAGPAAGDPGDGVGAAPPAPPSRGARCAGAAGPAPAEPQPQPEPVLAGRGAVAPRRASRRWRRRAASEVAQERTCARGCAGRASRGWVFGR